MSSGNFTGQIGPGTGLLEVVVHPTRMLYFMEDLHQVQKCSKWTLTPHPRNNEALEVFGSGRLLLSVRRIHHRYRYMWFPTGKLIWLQSGSEETTQTQEQQILIKFPVSADCLQRETFIMDQSAFGKQHD